VRDLVAGLIILGRVDWTAESTIYWDPNKFGANFGGWEVSPLKLTLPKYQDGIGGPVWRSLPKLLELNDVFIKHTTDSKSTFGLRLVIGGGGQTQPK
jgi:hypothetical protein